MIRKAVKSDFPAIVQVWERAVKATHHFLTAADFDFFHSELAAKWLPAMELKVFVTETGNINGFIGYHQSAGKLEIEALFVDPACFGQGIGRSLLDCVIQSGLDILLDVNEQNEQALAFYKKYGFIITGTSQTDAFGKPYPLIHMRLKK